MRRKSKVFSMKISSILCFVIILASCGLIGSEAREGEQLSAEQGGEILDRALTADNEIESYALAVSQVLDADVDNESYTFLNTIEMQSIGEDAIRIRMENSETNTVVEVIGVDGTIYMNNNDSYWELADELTEEELATDEAISYSYLDILKESEVEFEIYEMEEVYRFYVEAEGEEASVLSDRIDTQLSGIDENSLENRINDYGLSKLLLTVDVDKQTYYQTAFSLRMEGEDEIYGMSAFWDQRIEGIFYDMNAVSPIEAPEVEWVEGSDPFDESEELSEAEEWIHRMLTATIDSYSIEANYSLENSETDEFYERKESGDIYNRREGGQFTITETINEEPNSIHEWAWTEYSSNLYFRENEENWSRPSVVPVLIGEQIDYNQMIDQIFWNNGSHFSMERLEGEVHLFLEENLEEAHTDLDTLRSVMNEMMLYHYSEADIDSYLNEEDAIIRVHAYFDEMSGELRTVSYELEQDNLRIMIQMDYDNIDEVHEFIIPDAIVDEAAGSE